MSGVKELLATARTYKMRDWCCCRLIAVPAFYTTGFFTRATSLSLRRIDLSFHKAVSE
jgi:hypothetical protein